MSMRSAAAAVGAIGSVLLLAACSSGPSGAGTSPTPATTPVATVTATASPSPSAAPTASASTTPSASASASGAAGCSEPADAIPAGATTATIADVDGDGRNDTEFYSESDPPFTYGIRTAAGGVYTIPDGLAGPGAHSGWTAAFDAVATHLTVLDDGRTANLHVFVDCGFVTPVGVDGKPYTFGLAGYTEHGTGVACDDRNGGTLLEGAEARKRADGRYDVLWTQIDVSADGRTATNGATETRWSGLAADDPRVLATMGSHCGDVPKVGTSGK